MNLPPAGASVPRTIFIGASTGGTEAIREVLRGLPETTPAILVVQHMPEMFTPSFARRLDEQCVMRVKEAAHDDLLETGTVYISPGHSHLSVSRSPRGLRCALAATPPVNRHRPSVDVLFRSAVSLGQSALGVLLTGMGRDGAAGLLEMARAGAWTIAQDEATSVVYGMPREAVRIGAAREVVPLPQIAARICARLAAVERRV